MGFLNKKAAPLDGCSSSRPAPRAPAYVKLGNENAASVGGVDVEMSESKMLRGVATGTA
jgi:hypothetical protein